MLIVEFKARAKAKAKAKPAKKGAKGKPDVPLEQAVFGVPSDYKNVEPCH